MDGKKCVVCSFKKETCYNIQDKIIMGRDFPALLLYVSGIKVGAIRRKNICVCSDCVVSLLHVESVIKLFHHSLDKLTQKRSWGKNAQLKDGPKDTKNGLNIKKESIKLHSESVTSEARVEVSKKKKKDSPKDKEVDIDHLSDSSNEEQDVELKKAKPKESTEKNKKSNNLRLESVTTSVDATYEKKNNLQHDLYKNKKLQLESEQIPDKSRFETPSKKSKKPKLNILETEEVYEKDNIPNIFSQDEFFSENEQISVTQNVSKKQKSPKKRANNKEKEDDLAMDNGYLQRQEEDEEELHVIVPLKKRKKDQKSKKEKNSNGTTTTTELDEESYANAHSQSATWTKFRDVNKEPKTATKKEKIACVMCGKKYKSKSELREHTMKSHLASDTNCSSCGKHFSSRDKCEEHIFSEICSTYKQICLIQDCNRRFAKMSQLQKHTELCHGNVIS